MPRVSSKKLPIAFEDDLLAQLVHVLTRIKKKNGKKLLSALFTDEERTMLAKRVAVLIMLREKVSTYRIVAVLKMSSSTVMRMKHDYETGKYSALIQPLGKSKREREEFWQMIEVILRAGMPSRGKDRWKWLDKHFPRS